MRRWPRLLAVAMVALGCRRAAPHDDAGAASEPDAANADADAIAPAASAAVEAPPMPPPPPRRGMLWIPPGTLVAGTPPDRFPRLADEEMPGDPIALDGFFIDEYPYPNEAGAIPKTDVTQGDAQDLCVAQKKRLCSELEWERACKGAKNSTYEYGDVFRPTECPTGSPGRLLPNGVSAGCQSSFRVRDMHGGPWEWTSSPWGRSTNGKLAALRGGDADAEAAELVGRCANASGRPPESRRADVGFRCCGGERNDDEVQLAAVRQKTLIQRILRAPEALLLENTLRSAEIESFPPGLPIVVDRVWSWHPIANEELTLAAACVKLSAHLVCGVAVFRETETSATLAAFAPVGWWKPDIRVDRAKRDVWVFGGDRFSSLHRRVSYVWGLVRVGEIERAIKFREW